MKRIAVTGGNGLLGSKLLQVAESAYRLVSIDLQEEPFLLPKNGEYIAADITDQESLFQKLDSFQLNGMIHTAAFTHVDACESQKGKAQNVNIVGAENVAKYCAARQIRLIHVSTDYVFDGTAGPYREEDKPNPVSFYGKTKLEGEIAVQNYLDDFVIARTTVLYGYAPGVRSNFVTWLIDQLLRNQPVKIVDSQYGNPTLADDLAQALLILFEKEVKGIYNTVGSDWLSRYEFAQCVAEIFKLDTTWIRSIKETDLKQPAQRPSKGGLIIDKIRCDTGYQFLSAKDGLEKMKSQMIKYGAWPSV